MKVRWIHTSDVHLGYYQYGSPERAADFVRAFKEVCDYAIDARADFMLIAGDLFHKRSVDARTLMQAYELLSRLKEADIPVLCVEGNHERAFYNAGWSWLDFLSNTGLIYLLSPNVHERPTRLDPWDPEDYSGGFVDIGPVRVLGIKYFGASAPRVLSEISEQLSRDGSRPFSVMMLHEGLEGQLPRETGGLSSGQLELLRPHSEYLAMGHIHKQYEFGGWAYNPGSLETCSSEEVAWERGFYEVTADTSTRELVEVNLKHVNRRPFQRVFVQVEGFDTPEMLREGIFAEVQRRMRSANSKPPVLEVILRGTLQFADGAIGVSELESALQEKYNPLLTRLRNNTLPAGYDSRYVTDDEGQIDRRSLELEVFKDLVARDARFAARSSNWAESFQRIKDLATDCVPPEEIFRTLEHEVEHARSIVEEGGAA